MRLLIDNALAPELGRLLAESGHDAVHIRDLISPSSPDEVIFELAAEEDRIVISADTDFGMILAVRQASKPSVILLRHDAPVIPSEQAARIEAILAIAREKLLAGCIVSITAERVRVRMLPFR